MMNNNRMHSMTLIEFYRKVCRRLMITKDQFGSYLASFGRFGATPRSSREEVFAAIRPLRAINCGIPLRRMGGDNDGGYLVPDCLEGLKFCFSPGVSDNSSFELECADLGMDVFLADASVVRAAETHERFTFIKKFIDSYSHDEFVSFREWFEASAVLPDTEGILQMDIEGFEYRVLSAIEPEMLKRFRVIVLEIHEVHLLWSKPFLDRFTDVFSRIGQDYACIHVHANNCHPVVKCQGITLPMTVEVTLLRKDYVAENTAENHRFEFPHDLDQPNLAHKKDIKLGREWSADS